jgi:hypothetical protein
MARNPDFSREEAIEYLKQVKAEAVEFNTPAI